MYLTKPAGVFLQLLSIVFFFWAFFAMSWWIAGFAVVLLVVGGIPATQKDK